MTTSLTRCSESKGSAAAETGFKRSVDGKLNEDVLSKRLEEEVDRAFDKVEESFNPTVACLFKGVNYETITSDKHFRERIETYFGQRRSNQAPIRIRASRAQDHLPQMNTPALKAFAPAVRRQLMEAVTRKLDFVLSAQDARLPDHFCTASGCAAEVGAGGSHRADRARRLHLVQPLHGLAVLGCRDGILFAPASSLQPAEETQPELLKLMRTGALPEDLQRHTNPRPAQ